MGTGHPFIGDMLMRECIRDIHRPLADGRQGVSCSPFALFAFLFVVLLATPSWAQTGRITGQVIARETGESLPGANIELIGSNLTEKMGALSDAEGRYTILDVPPGAYTLKVTFVGYLETTVENVVVSVDESVEVNIRLSVSPYELKEIVVTARKRKEDLQKVPISITAIDVSTIEQRGADRIHDLEYAVPNLKFARTQTNGNTQVNIRGIGDYSRNIGHEARAGVYIDGIYAGRSVAVNQDLLDLEGVEVLRGPQGTLFGKNTVSGAISLTTRKPNGLFQGKFSIEAGNFRHIQPKIILNVPLIENKLFAKIAAKKLNRNGFIKNLHNGKDLNGQNTLGGKFQLRYLASEALELNLNIDGLTERTSGTFFVAIGSPEVDLAPDPREVNHDADEFFSRDMFSGSLSVDYEFPSGYALKSMSSYSTSDVDNLLDDDYTNQFILAVSRNQQNRHATQEIRLTSPLGQTVDFVTGLYYFYQKAATKLFYNLGPTFAIPNYHGETPGNVKTNSVAGYFHGNVHLTDKVSLTGGLRYTYEKKGAALNLRK